MLAPEFTAVNGACSRRSSRFTPRLFMLQCLALPAAILLAPAPAIAQPQHEVRTALLGLQDAFTSIADEVEPTVVTVSSTKAVRGPDNPGFGRRNGGQAFRQVGTGTGLIVRKDGWILTNDHVVSGADRVTVKFHDGREAPGSVLRDPRSDLALVKVEVKGALPVAKLGDSDKVRIGQWAIAIGSPFKYEGSLSVGVISSLARKQEIEDPSDSPRGRLYPNLIQTDAAINPGNSGGPLCNINGEVIAINTAIQSPQSQGGSIGIGFAIPINVAKFVMAQLLDKGKVSYGYLGVSPTSVTPKEAIALKVESGALIFRDPPKDSPADKAGIKAGDVITAIAGKPVKNEIDLRSIVSQTAPNTTVEIKLVHEGEVKLVSATLEKAEDEPIAPMVKPNGKPSLGVDVDKLTDARADRAGVPHSTLGVYVTSIDPNSSAADEDEFSEGSVIMKVNDKETPTVEAYNEAIAGLKAGDLVRLVYLQKDSNSTPAVRRFLVLTVD